MLMKMATLDKIDVCRVLSKIRVFEDLEVSALERIVSVAEMLNLSPGERLFRVGESAEVFFVVLSGSVQITAFPSGEPENLIAPTLLGLKGMLANAKRRVSVIANESCRILKLDRPALKALASELPLLRSRIRVLARKPSIRNDAPLRSGALPSPFNHRQYVGGFWTQIGLLQFNFLQAQGLMPSHCLLDIGCGALRGGVHFIPYLDPGNYLGLDCNQSLIEHGIAQELGIPAYEERKPIFVVSDCFEFNRFPKIPHFSIAQSLFTHLVAADICLCLANLRNFVANNHVLFATFYGGLSAHNPKISHSQKGFHYTPGEMEGFGRVTGWKSTYIGHWWHPRHQMMIKYEST